MKQYISNLILFVRGFRWLNNLTYKDGWGPRKFLPMYAIDYGLHVLSGGAVISFSRWFYDNRQRYWWARAADSILNWFDKDHGKKAGPALWGTTDCAWPVRLVFTVLWCYAIFAGVRGLWRLFT